MTSEYKDIYSCFLGRITDYKFWGLDESDANDFMRDWLRSAATRPFMRKLFSVLSFDDEIEVVTYSLYNSIDEDFDKDFVENILARGMVIEWLEPKVKATTNINQMFGNSDQKYYSQSSHLAEITSLLESTKIELRKMIRDYPYAKYGIDYSNGV